jgi:spore coat polysaccharide biosynthesis protein SpsF (cytidylyltransferase family)
MAQENPKKLLCVAVIQARRGSSRLPDKILKPLAGTPVLARVIDRCSKIAGVDCVICAIPEGGYNNPVAELALASGAVVSRGSEQDVLARYMGAMDGIDSQYVMRVTSDCPLLDPDVCAQLLTGVIENRVEYGATAGWPHGLDCEVFSGDLLVEAHREATHPNDREHVTLWMKRRCLGRDFILNPDKNYMEEYRWVLDYPEDLDFLEALVPLLPKHPALVGWQEVMAIVDAHPGLKALNGNKIEEWAQKNHKIYAEAAEAE